MNNAISLMLRCYSTTVVGLFPDTTIIVLVDCNKMNMLTSSKYFHNSEMRHVHTIWVLWECLRATRTSFKCLELSQPYEFKVFGYLFHGKVESGTVCYKIEGNEYSLLSQGFTPKQHVGNCKP